MSYFSPMQGNFAGISPMQACGAAGATPAEKPAKKPPVRKGASERDIKKAHEAQTANAKAGIKLQQKKKTGAAKPAATDPAAKKPAAKKPTDKPSNPKSTASANSAAKKPAVKKGVTTPPAPSATGSDNLISFGKSKNLKIKQLKNGEYRLVSAKNGKSLPINKEFKIIKNKKGGFSIIDKATQKRVSIKSILAKLKGNTPAGNAAENAGKTAAKEGIFKRIGTAIKSHPKTTAAIAIAATTLGLYKMSKSDSEGN